MSAAAGTRPNLPARAPVAGPPAPAFSAPAVNLDPAPRAVSPAPAPETATATLRPVRPQPARLQAARFQPTHCTTAPSRPAAPSRRPAP